MSKEIAQTVGGKRIAWLIAIVAAFAVFAMVSSQFRSASADVAAADIVIDEYDTAEVPPLPEAVDLADPFGDPDTVGDMRYYKISVLPLANSTLGDLRISATFDQQVVSVSGTAIGGSNAGCTFTNDPSGNGSVICTWNGPIPAGASGTVIVQTQVNDLDGSGFAIAPFGTAQDLGSAQGTVLITNQTVGFQISAANLAITKTAAPATVEPGDTVVYTFVITNDDDGANAPEVAAANVTMVDDLGGVISEAEVLDDGPYTCSFSGLVLTCTIASHPVDVDATITVLATIDPDTTATFFTNTASVTSPLNFGDSDSATVNIDQPDVVQGELDPGLYHVSQYCDPSASWFVAWLDDFDWDDFNINGFSVAAQVLDGETECLVDFRDDPNNVIGYVHMVCLAGEGEDILDIIDESDFDGIIPPSTADGEGLFWRIDNVIGGGQATVNGQSMFQASAYDDDGIVFENGALECVRWYSTAPGEQNVTVVNGDGEVVANWHGSDDAYEGPGDEVLDPVDAYEPLVKEWNILTPTAITLRASSPAVPGDGLLTLPAGTDAAAVVASINLDGSTIARPTNFNANTATYDALAPVELDEHVFGSHQSVGGPVPASNQALWVDGARVTFTISGTCGEAWIDPDGDTTLEGSSEYIYYDDTVANRSVTVTSIGQPINFDVDTYECASLDGSSTTVTISADYPTNIGSVSPTPPADEEITIIWTSTVPVKPIILAWAGQRVIVEHDWRIPAGDMDDATATDPNEDYIANGECVFDGETDVIAVRGSGPGNFIAALGASVNNLRDTATVELTGENSQHLDAPSDPQDACISRFLYESEDPGQVDIEMFVASETSSTKIAVVIYYMKIEAVETSLVTSVEKPTHNGTGSDFAPGNPWNTENDASATEWNVSKDLLVRVRVKGWFVNANPSGRERDASDPFNVLPQDRWVMPDDWGVLIAGGAGIDFRPEYDYMFAPDSGVSLTTPEGAAAQIGATVTAASAGTVISVSAATPFTAGQTVIIGSTCASTVTRTITAVDTVNNRITVNAAIVVAEGNVVCFTTGVPFEGPFSLIDIQGRAPLNGGAALSNWDPDNIRDTRLGDNRLDWWDAPMPSTPITVDIRGAGFIKQVLKSDVYYIGTPNSTAQVYPNPYYITNIPESPYISSSAGGGSFLWNSWGNDGPGGNGDGVYRFWNPVRIGVNIAGNPGETLTANQQNELKQIRAVYGDDTIARRLVVFSDNHGEAMVIANGDFNLDYAGCAVNALAGGRHCAQGDVVGSSDIYATADYPDFRGKHFPVRGPIAEVDWTWGGYKEVTVQPGEVEQFVYVVFHALDRDGFCVPPTGAVSLHPVHTPTDVAVAAVADAAHDFPNASGVGPNAQIELVDFLIDSDEGGIFVETSAGKPGSVTREFAEGVPTYSTSETARTLTAQNDLRKFEPINGSTAECQSWVKISNSLLGVTNVLVIAANDEGNVGFDVIVDFQSEMDYTLNFRWSLITWAGADNIPPMDALSGTGDNEGGTDILDEVTAVYGWEASSQSWLAFFPDGVDVPGANDLTGLRTGHAYWIAIRGPESITWTVVTDVNN